MSDTSPTSIRVSVIIPTHNRAALLPEALNSVLTQGPAVTEIIVVDDGSTDHTADVIAQMGEPRIRYVQQANAGPAVARDHGLRLATGTHLMFLDSDDMLEPGIVSKLAAAATDHPGTVPFGRASVHTETPLNPAVYTFTLAERSGVLLPELAFYDTGTIFAAIYPKELLQRIGGFVDQGCCHACEDHDLALRLAFTTEFFYLPEMVYRIRMHGGNRHRAQRRNVWSCQRDSAARHLDRAGTKLLRRRVMAYFHGRIAESLREEGLSSQAAREYWHCLLLWPIKLGAWRGLAKSLFRRSKKTV